MKNTPSSAAPPHALDMARVYEKAIVEISRPFPSVKLPDWDGFNRITGGFRPKEYSILCGSTGTGKTTLIANISAQLLLAKVPQFVMSVETGHTDYMKRIISALAYEDVNTGDPVDEVTVKRIHDQFGELFLTDLVQFSLYEDRVPVETLKSDIRWMVKNKGVKVVFIDNLNFFMEPTKAAEWNLEMDRVTHELIILHKQLEVHSMMVMHPRKTDGTQVRNEFDIKGSSTAVQEAHNIFLFNKPRPEDIESGARHPTDRELLINKMRRRGRFAGHTLVFKCQGATYVEATIE